MIRERNKFVICLIQINCIIDRSPLPVSPPKLFSRKKCCLISVNCSEVESIDDVCRYHFSLDVIVNKIFFTRSSPSVETRELERKQCRIEVRVDENCFVSTRVLIPQTFELEIRINIDLHMAFDDDRTSGNNKFHNSERR